MNDRAKPRLAEPPNELVLAVRRDMAQMLADATAGKNLLTSKELADQLASKGHAIAVSEWTITNAREKGWLTPTFEQRTFRSVTHARVWLLQHGSR